MNGSGSTGAPRADPEGHEQRSDENRTEKYNEKTPDGVRQHDTGHQNDVRFTGHQEPVLTPGMNGTQPVSHNGGYGTFGSRLHAQYEELFEGTMACPTCRGTGRISRDSADELVALIPVRDSRLKPRRTCLYVAIAVFLCVTVGTLLLVFLFPRSIRLDSDSHTLKPEVRIVNTTAQYVFLRVKATYNITNDNFFSVTVNKLEVASQFDQKAQASFVNNTQLSIPLRSTRTHYVELNITFSGSEGYIAYYCSSGIPGSHSLLMPFMATMTTSYWGHSEETTLTSYKHVQCGPIHKDR